MGKLKWPVGYRSKFRTRIMKMRKYSRERARKNKQIRGFLPLIENFR